MFSTSTRLNRVLRIHQDCLQLLGAFPISPPMKSWRSKAASFTISSFPISFLPKSCKAFPPRVFQTLPALCSSLRIPSTCPWITVRREHTERGTDAEGKTMRSLPRRRGSLILISQCLKHTASWSETLAPGAKLSALSPYLLLLQGSSTLGKTGSTWGF